MSLHIMNHSSMHLCVLILMVTLNYRSSYGQSSYYNGDGKKSISVTRKPNIVVMISDDMGWGDLGANWKQPSQTVMHDSFKTLTPNLDNLAKEGLRLTDFHAAASVCAPSRAAFLTSRLGLRTGVVDNFNVDSVGGLPQNETTIARMLLDAGYRTAMFGKWHLGLTKGHHPLDHGFQSYFGVPYSLDMGCTNPPGVNVPDCPGCPFGNYLKDWKSFSLRSDVGDHFLQCREDIGIPLISNRSIANQPVNLGKLSSMYGMFAENFILDSDFNDHPFFLYAAFSHVHVPLLTEHGTNSRHEVFKESLLEMDSIVGKIVRAVKKLKYKNRYSEFPSRDTLIWFFSDNGPWEVKCDLSGSWGPFSGKWQRSLLGGGGGGASKQTVWEGGHRVPSIIHWPSQIKRGRVSNALLSSLDVMPTLAAITGAKLPKNRSYDGQDISHIILKNGKKYINSSSNTFKFEKRVLFHPNSGASGHDGDIGAIRIGPYKAVLYSGGCPDCSGYYPPRANHSDKPLIFNLSEDPAESSPLSTQSRVYNLVKNHAMKALDSLHLSLKADNITVANYSTNPIVRPCCSSNSPVCRCPWD